MWSVHDNTYMKSLFHGNLVTVRVNFIDNCTRARERVLAHFKQISACSNVL